MVNTAIVLACAEGIIKNYDSNLLAANGWNLVPTSNWGKSLLRQMGFVKGRVSTTAKIAVPNFEEVKAQFLLDINVGVEMDEIPPALVINLDQTGIHYVPAGSWTMEKEGAKKVEIVAADDKRQIHVTAVFAGTLSGDFLPPQLIYKGTTHCCLYLPWCFLTAGISLTQRIIGLLRRPRSSTRRKFFSHTSRRPGVK